MSDTRSDFLLDSHCANEMLCGIAYWLNEKLIDHTPAEIAFMTLVGWEVLRRSAPTLYSGYRYVNRFGVAQSAVDLVQEVKEGVPQLPKIAKHMLVNSIFNAAVKIPKVGPLVEAYGQEQVEKEIKGVFEKNFARREKNGFNQLELPDNKQTVDEILADVDKIISHPELGKQSGAIYTVPDTEMKQLISGMSDRFAFSNTTQTEVFPECSDMEAQVVAWVSRYFNGDYPQVDVASMRGKTPKPSNTLSQQEEKASTSTSYLTKAQSWIASTRELFTRLSSRAGKKALMPPGLVTSGGTESNGAAIWMAVAAARDRGIQEPEIIVPDSMHTSFDNLANKFHAKLIRVPVDKKTGKANVDAMRRKINDNTCLIAGSAPSFPKGVFDPIDQLAALAQKHNIPFHMDACIGFPQVFATRAGIKMPHYGLDTPGVTSVSCDTHKYLFSTKDSSVVMFNHKQSNSPKFRAHGHYDWMGGLYVAPFSKGSRSGRPAAEAYAVMRYIGDAGYLEIMKNILLLAREVEVVVKQIPGVSVAIPVESTILTIDTEKGINSHLVASQLKKAGWDLNPLMPTGFHFCFTSVHLKVPNFVKIFSDALADAVSYAKTHSKEDPEGLIKAYGTLPKKMQETPDAVKHELGAAYIAANNTIPVAPVRRMR